MHNFDNEKEIESFLEALRLFYGFDGFSETYLKTESREKSVLLINEIKKIVKESIEEIFLEPLKKRAKLDCDVDVYLGLEDNIDIRLKDIDFSEVELGKIKVPLNFAFVDIGNELYKSIIKGDDEISKSRKSVFLSDLSKKFDLNGSFLKNVLKYLNDKKSDISFQLNGSTVSYKVEYIESLASFSNTKIKK